MAISPLWIMILISLCPENTARVGAGRCDCNALSHAGGGLHRSSRGWVSVYSHQSGTTLCQPVGLKTALIIVIIMIVITTITTATTTATTTAAAANHTAPPLTPSAAHPFCPRALEAPCMLFK